MEGIGVIGVSCRGEHGDDCNMRVGAVSGRLKDGTTVRGHGSSYGMGANAFIGNDACISVYGKGQNSTKYLGVL